MVEMIRKMYENPRFYVEVDGVKSTWKKQEKGIRQGCPLSPYLFIMVMNRVFEQVNAHTDALTNLISARNFQEFEMEGLKISELLFADDTLIFAQDKDSIEGLLWAVEVISGIYGLKLNKDKCVEISSDGGQDAVMFQNGGMVERKGSAEYLGTSMNVKADPAREVNRRIVAARAAQAKLDILWKDVRISTKWKILMYDAIVGAKLAYGLEALPMHEALHKKIDALYYCGMRKILGMKST